jgi:ferrous iron transport protein B
LIFNDKRYKVVDLPGTYSLLSTSVDEDIARNFILFGQPDVTVIVVDSTRLERNLNLVLQVLEITSRAVVCLNLTDEAKRHGLQVDDRLLAKELGVPVVPTSARHGQGIQTLLSAIHEVATGAFVCKPHRVKSGVAPLERAVSELAAKLEDAFPGLANARWVALRLLDGDVRIADAIRNGELEGLIPTEAGQPVRQAKQPEVVPQ